MAPISGCIRSVQLKLDELPKPNEHEPMAASCSPLVQETAFVFQAPGNPKQSFIDGEIWPPVFKPDSLRLIYIFYYITINFID